MKMKLCSALFGGAISFVHQAYNLSDVNPSVFPMYIIKKRLVFFPTTQQKKIIVKFIQSFTPNSCLNKENEINKGCRELHKMP